MASDKKWIGISDELITMEQTKGWKWLKNELEEDMENLTDAILDNEKFEGEENDDVNRGQLKYIRNIFALIKQVHKNKEEVNG